MERQFPWRVANSHSTYSLYGMTTTFGNQWLPSYIRPPALAATPHLNKLYNLLEFTPQERPTFSQRHVFQYPRVAAEGNYLSWLNYTFTIYVSHMSKPDLNSCQ